MGLKALAPAFASDLDPFHGLVCPRLLFTLLSPRGPCLFTAFAPASPPQGRSPRASARYLPVGWNSPAWAPPCPRYLLKQTAAIPRFALFIPFTLSHFYSASKACVTFENAIIYLYVYFSHPPLSHWDAGSMRQRSLILLFTRTSLALRAVADLYSGADKYLPNFDNCMCKQEQLIKNAFKKI